MCSGFGTVLGHAGLLLPFFTIELPLGLMEPWASLGNFLGCPRAPMFLPVMLSLSHLTSSCDPRLAMTSHHPPPMPFLGSPTQREAAWPGGGGTLAL